LQQRFAIAYQYSLCLVQNTTFGGDKITKKLIVTPGDVEGRYDANKLRVKIDINYFYRYSLRL
jgi:hypothetical protein